MKKILFALIAIIVLVGCSKENESQSYYSEKQEKAFALFNGTWADIQFSNLNETNPLKLDPDKIVFGNHNSQPIKVYKDNYIDGKILLFDNQGECTFYSIDNNDTGYKKTECYYCISNDADIFLLYRKENNALFKTFNMYIKSETKINLHDTRMTLPYIFVKQ